MRIAVTGASGQVGGQVVRLLAGEQAHQVVALSRRVLPSGRWPAGVSARAAGYADPEALSTALAVRTRWCLSRATVRWRRSWSTITT
ncbi:MAG TPA: NAD-dependent epimerase/dehydratase family protein [Trebonia sp.]|nr:NAD-dependent epimerase/dehydratase family protein [Trebonia sp.]